VRWDRRFAPRSQQRRGRRPTFANPSPLSPRCGDPLGETPGGTRASGRHRRLSRESAPTPLRGGRGSDARARPGCAPGPPRRTSQRWFAGVGRGTPRDARIAGRQVERPHRRALLPEPFHEARRDLLPEHCNDSDPRLRSGVADMGGAWLEQATSCL
jgi:hypothetical protein